VGLLLEKRIKKTLAGTIQQKVQRERDERERERERERRANPRKFTETIAGAILDQLTRLLEGVAGRVNESVGSQWKSILRHFFITTL
jgi:hypothetical protein